MTTLESPGPAVTTEPAIAAPTNAPLDRAAGIQLLGPVHGSGYSDGVSLVRRFDGQMLQLGPLLYGVLEAADGHRNNKDVAAEVSARLGRHLTDEQVERIAQKLAAQGLLAGSEAAAPPRRNPLLALRWKVLVTNPKVTRRLTAPFTFLFRPFVMWPILAAFGVVCWFVLFDKGLAGATAQAFRSPGLLLLVFALGVVSAGFHEFGHAAACRYAGATPGGMGVGFYLVWPAFYTDVTDAYRLPRRDRLRVDLAGLYFNAVIAVVITGIWLYVRADALLLVAALQLLLMVKQLSPVIRADGYHILADLTGVPDLFAHLGPTMRRLIPGRRREPSALTGKARALVTLWVLIVIPVLLSLMVGAVLLLPRLATSAWDSGRTVTDSLALSASHGDLLSVGADVLRLFALFLPVLGSSLVAQRLTRSLFSRGLVWSRHHPLRRAGLAVVTAGVAAALAWAWWPSGQYQPVRPTDSGTLPSLVSTIAAPDRVARPESAPIPLLPPGRYVALAMVPKAGASAAHPAMFVVQGQRHHPPVALLSTASSTAPAVAAAPLDSASPTASPMPTSSTPAAAVSPSSAPTGSLAAAPVQAPTVASAFPFALPAAPGPGGTQALATNQTDGGVVYNVAYALVTVSDGASVTNTNSAFAIAHCQACTTVAVSFQLVLIVGQSHAIAPINAAGALNYECPQCVTTAIADQMVVTLSAQPSEQLDQKLEAALAQLNLLPQLGAGATPATIAAEVSAVQQQVVSLLQGSGLVVTPSASASPTDSASPSDSSSPTASTATSPQPAAATTSPSTASPSPTPTDSASPTASDSPSATASPSGSPSPSPS